MSNSQQLSARERIECLLDSNSFVEIGALMTKRNTDFNIQSKESLSDGIITGYGVIDCNPVYVYSQDISALNGTIGEMHAKKIGNLYDLAMKIGVPVIGLIDCGGLRLEEATDALAAFGEIYTKQVLASGVIPQITAIFGKAGGAEAISTSLSDFTFMMKDTGKLFVNAPNTLDGNYVEKCDTSSAEYQAKEGNVDFVYDDEELLLAGIASLVKMIPANNEDDASYEECQDSLNGLTSDLGKDMKDSAISLSIISDDSQFIEVKKDYAKEMVTGFIKLNGLTIGAVANRAEIFDEEGKSVEKFDNVLTVAGCKKAKKFVKICNAYGIPLLTLTDVKGFKATMCAEKKMADAVAKLTYAFTNATVPKVNLITNEAYGTAYIAMNSKHIGADMVFAWEDTFVGTMEADKAVKIMYADEKDASVIAEKKNEYNELLASANSAAKRGYVDAIISPEATRKNLIYAFEMLFTKREGRPCKKNGTV